MATLTMEYPQVLLTGPGKQTRPAWIGRQFSPKVLAATQIRHLKRLPGLTVVRAAGPANILEEKDFLAVLATRHHETPEPAKILFVFEARSRRPDPRALLQVLAFFDRAGDVEFARGADQARFALDEAVAKIWADLRHEVETSSPDPLREVKSVLAATADLRSDAGRLSAQRIAAEFGLSLAQLATLLGRSRQALWKTDDAETVQEQLHPFERVARLRAVLPPGDFRSWLNMPNQQLDELAPIEIIRRGQVGVVADLAEDMLTGSPA